MLTPFKRMEELRSVQKQLLQQSPTMASGPWQRAMYISDFTLFKY